MKKLLLVAAAVLALLGSAHADYNITTPLTAPPNTTLRVVKSGVDGSGNIINYQSPIDATGAAFGTVSNPFALQFGTGITLPAFTTPPTVNLGTLNGAATAANQSVNGATTAHTCSVAGFSELGCLGQIDDDVRGPIAAGTAIIGALLPNQSVNLTQLNSVALGSPSNYGTSPGAVAVSGVNAFVTNSVTVAQPTGSNLHVVCDSGCSGGGGGGTSSNFGSTFPTVGTAIGASNGTNMVAITLGQQLAASSLPVVLTAAQLTTLTPPTSVGITGSVAVTGTFFQATQPVSGTVTAAQATAGALNATVVGTGTFAVQAAQAGSWTATVTQATGTNLHMVCDSGCSSSSSPTFGAAFPTTGTPVGMSQGGNLVAMTGTAGALNVNISSGSIANTSFAATQATAGALNATVVGTGTFAVQAAQSGTWNITNVSGTVSLPTGAATAALQPTNAAQGSTTSGQTGPLMQAAVLTAAPTYTTAQTSPLTMTTGGALRVADASVVTALGTPFQAGGSIGNTTFAATQATAGSLNATVVGTGTFAVQATLQASASTAIGKVDPNTIGTWGIVVSTQNSATPTNMHLMAAQFNTTPTTITTGNVSALQLDSAGNLLVNIKTGASSGAVAQGSTTSGQTGGLIQAAATTSAPTYTTATTNPLSMDTSGNLRVTVAAAIGLAQGATTSGQTGSLIMGAVTTSAPTYTTAQTSPISLDTAGNIRINCVTGCAAGSVSNASSAVATSSTNSGTVAYNYGFNGATWDQFQVDGSKNLKTVFSNTTIAVTNTGTFAVQAAQSGTWNIGTITTLPALAAGSALVGKVGIDQTTPGTTNAVQDAADGSTGSAVPAKATYTGSQGSTGLAGQITCDQSAVYDASTNGSTQLVALSSGKSIYVCGWTITTGATATNVKLIYGTGTACVTSPQPVLPAFQLGANSGVVDSSSIWGGIKTAASQELCINTSAGNPVQAVVKFAQF